MTVSPRRKKQIARHHTALDRRGANDPAFRLENPDWVERAEQNEAIIKDESLSDDAVEPIVKAVSLAGSLTALLKSAASRAGGNRRADLFKDRDDFVLRLLARRLRRDMPDATVPELADGVYWKLQDNPEIVFDLMSESGCTADYLERLLDLCRPDGATIKSSTIEKLISGI